MLYVEDFHRYLYAAALIGSNTGPRIANPGLHIGNRPGDSRDHPGTVLRNRQQLDGVGRFVGTARPFDGDDSFRVHHQLPDVFAALGVDSDAFAPGNVTDDFFTVQRITTPRPVHHQIVDSAHDDRIVAQPNQSLHRPHASAQSGFFLRIELGELLGAKVLGNDIAWNKLAVSDRCQQILNSAVSIFTGNALKVAVAVA